MVNLNKMKCSRRILFIDSQIISKFHYAHKKTPAEFLQREFLLRSI